jgi:hypothetical protein
MKVQYKFTPYPMLAKLQLNNPEYKKMRLNWSRRKNKHYGAKTFIVSTFSLVHWYADSFQSVAARWANANVRWSRRLVSNKRSTSRFANKYTIHRYI